MRILFICSCLEPGRDGVGDYARRLAEECTALGHSCALVALNDPNVRAVVEENQGTLPTLRLPHGADYKAAVAFREKFAPDWISLQLVAYGLHPRGMLHSTIPHLYSLVGSVPLDLMMHELWLGNDEKPTLKQRITGALQRASLARLIAALRPARIATTNPVYAAQLGTIGIKARISPLFGNVPVLPGEPVPDDIAGRLRPCNDWIGLFFGGLYHEWKPEPFFTHLAQAARTLGRSVGLVQLGNAGGEGEQVWADLERDYSSTFTFVRLGQQPASVVSAVMQVADFGIAASPWILIGKSGSAAAMLDHGLPVIVTRDDFKPRITSPEPPTTDPLVLRDDATLEAKLVAGLPQRAPRSHAPEAARAWLQELAEARQ